ncbi:MAG TPA: site-2 protease family protein [Vicinamibacteria bacterium]
MIGQSFRVASIFGIPIKVDLSWVLVLFLLTSTFALNFSREHPGLGWSTWVTMGFALSALLFASVLAHELSHAVVAIREGISIRGITLFIFGGAAEMVDEPPHAGAELKVALAGPAMSVSLAIVFAGVYSIGLGWFPASVLGVVGHLAFMNGVLAAFNLVPGFPLDGGRVLRAALWGIWGDLRFATRTASVLGSGFGLLIMLLGLVYLVRFGNLIGAVWYLFIGVFLRRAARASYQQVLLRDLLKGVKAGDVMNRAVVAVSSESTLDEIVSQVILPSGLVKLPVVDGTRLVGQLGLAEIRSIDRARWKDVRAKDVMRSDGMPPAVSPQDEATRLLSMAVRDDALIPVVDGERFVGVVTRLDLLRRLKLMMELPRS